MEKIYMIGDMHTVSAFRLAGVEGVVSGPVGVAARLEEIIRKKDAGIVLITNELAGDLEARIAQINLNMPSPVVIEIPGIDDPQGFRRSTMSYVSEALGISM
jgi:vacuolar-type H+-ATPase subunit F/Vma7